MAGLLVILVSLCFTPAMVLARLPRTCVRDRNVLSCSRMRDFKNEDILSAVMYEINIDFIYLTERHSYCFCKVVRLVQLLRVTDVIVFAYSKCGLDRLRSCGVKQSMPKSEVLAGLVVSMGDPRRNWALNHHVLHLWYKIQGIRNERIRSLFYAGILKDLKNEVKSLNIRAQEKLLAMRPPRPTTPRPRRKVIRGYYKRINSIRRRGRRGRRWRRRKGRRWRRRWRRRKGRLWRRRKGRRRGRMSMAEVARLLNSRIDALIKSIDKKNKEQKAKKRRRHSNLFSPVTTLVYYDSKKKRFMRDFEGERKRRKEEEERKRSRFRREVVVLQRPRSDESLFKQGSPYMIRLNSTQVETPFGNMTAIGKLTPVGKLKPGIIHQAREDSISEPEWRRSPNPVAQSWPELSHQPSALTRSPHSRMRRVAKTLAPPTVSPYLAFVGGEFYSLFDQEGIRLAQLQEVQPIGAEERLRAPRRNYPVTRVGKRRLGKSNRRIEQLAAKLKSPTVAPVVGKGVGQNGDLTQAEVKRLARESDHRMKSFIIFFVAITGTITIIAVLLIMAMRSSSESPRYGGRRRRGMNPDDMCRQCMAKMRYNENLMNQSEAEMYRRNPIYPYYDDHDPCCDRMTTQTEGNNCQPVLGGRQQFENWCMGIRDPKDKRLKDEQNYRQVTFNSPQPAPLYGDGRANFRPGEDRPPGNVSFNQPPPAPLYGDGRANFRPGDDRPPGRTQPDTNWNASSELCQIHSPLVSFLKSISTEKDGVMRDHHREKFNIQRWRQKHRYQPRLHGQLVPASRPPGPTRLCRPAETTPPAKQDEQRVTSLDNEIRLSVSSQ